MHSTPYKSTSLKFNIVEKGNLAILLLLCMVVGFLVSRFLLSVSMVLFGINALYNINLKRWGSNTWWLLSLLWLAGLAFSGLWTANMEQYATVLQLKLPLLLLPLAVGFLPKFTDAQVRVLLFSLGVCLLSGCFYSVYFLFADYQHFIEEYKISHLLPTLAKNDYISFSLSVALYVLIAVSQWSVLQTKTQRIAISLLIAVMVVYLHVLAAKSGLLSIYLILMVGGLYQAIVRRQWKGLLLVLAIPVVLTSAIFLLPTFRERKEYIVYTYYMYKINDKSGRFGDLSRLISFDLATDIIGQHPITGVGAGDVLDEMNKGYIKKYPEVAPENRLIPHNQFLNMAVGSGLVFMILMVIWWLYPLTWCWKNKKGIFIFIGWLVLFFQMMVEPYLEGQFGVFVFTFYAILLYHLCTPQQSIHQAKAR